MASYYLTVTDNSGAPSGLANAFAWDNPVSAPVTSDLEVTVFLGGITLVELDGVPVGGLHFVDIEYHEGNFGFKIDSLCPDGLYRWDMAVGHKILPIHGIKRSSACIITLDA